MTSHNLEINMGVADSGIRKKFKKAGLLVYLLYSNPVLRRTHFKNQGTSVFCLLEKVSERDSKTHLRLDVLCDDYFIRHYKGPTGLCKA